MTQVECSHVTFGALLAGLSVLSTMPIYAQTSQDEGSQPIPAVENEADSGPEPIDYQNLLEQCKTRGSLLEQALVGVVGPTSDPTADYQNQIASLETDLRNCQFDRKRDNTPNIALKKELDACRNDKGLAPPVLGGNCSPDEKKATEAEIEQLTMERDAARTELAQARADNRRLLERLSQKGVTAEPGYTYLGDAIASFKRPGEAISDVPQEDRLSDSKCADAIAWLNTQSGDQLWLFKQVWVWSETNDILLCRATSDNDVETIGASPTDEAHIVIFE